EELIYEEVSTGAHDDLTKATDIARSMVKTYGMSPKLGQISLERDRRTMLLASPEPAGRNDYSEETAREIDMEVRRIIDEQVARGPDADHASPAVRDDDAPDPFAQHEAHGVSHRLRRTQCEDGRRHQVAHLPVAEIAAASLGIDEIAARQHTHQPAPGITDR